MLSWKNLVIDSKKIPDLKLCEQDKSIQFVGPNQSCSQFFSVVNGLNSNYQGEILWKGKNIKDLNYQEDLDFRKHCSLVFSWGGLLSNQTLKENILLPFQYHSYNTKEVKECIYDFFKENRYYHYLQERPYHVPYNLRKLSAILRGLLFAKDCVFIEDICLGLEDKDIQALANFIQKLDKVIYFYDSLGKFNIKNADLIMIGKSYQEAVS